jgi:hypothetical protein
MKNKSDIEILIEATNIFEIAEKVMSKRGVGSATPIQIYRWAERDRLEEERQSLPWWKRPIHFLRNIF